MEYLAKLKQQKKKTEKASLIEQVQVDILGKQAENNNGDVFAKDLEEILQKYFSNEEANIKNIVEGTTKEGEETKLISKEDSNIKIDLSEIYSGEIKKIILAKDILIPDESGATPEEKSPYLKYDNILCRAFYNDEEHGLQIITNDSVTDVTLGYDDPTVTADDFVYNGSLTLNDKFKKAAASYNNAVDTLNNKAKEYMGTKAIDARSVGSIATLGENGKFQEDTSDMWSSNVYQYITDYSLNGVFKKIKDYSEDYEEMKDLDIDKTTSGIWITNRFIEANSINVYFSIYTLNSGGGLIPNVLGRVYEGGYTNEHSNISGLRPVFLLPSDIIISSGDGSLEDPYVIE